MAEWKVAREEVVILPFPKEGVDRLELARLGNRQAVVQKGKFKTGDVVIFVPEKSLLPDVIADEGDRRKYLVGTLKNRVKAVRLQGEPSEGLFLDDRPEFAEIPLGEDISAKLGIEKWEPPVPPQLAGQVHGCQISGRIINRHDVEQFGVNIPEFVPNEEVIVTEKVHGSQGAYIAVGNGEVYVSSKGLIGKQLYLKDDGTNTYWQAARNIGLWDLVEGNFPGKFVQVFGEVVPVQSGFTYGFNKPWLLIFRVEVEGRQLAYDEVPEVFKKHWVPILYRGPFDVAKITEVCKGSEQVSGKVLHIKEGGVVAPIVPRDSNLSKSRFNLMVKVLNPKYKDDPESFN